MKAVNPTNTSMTISIARDFSDVPWGRYPADGDACGQNFREKHLLPALRKDREAVVVNLDGLAGVAASFLDEAFGGLIRESRVPASTLRARLAVVTTQPELRMFVGLIWRYIAHAEALDPTQQRRQPDDCRKCRSR